MHGLIFETSVCYWQNQPGCYLQDFRLLLPLHSPKQRNVRIDYTFRNSDSLPRQSADFFPTKLCLLRLSDTLRLSSARRLTLNTYMFTTPVTTVCTTHFASECRSHNATKNDWKPWRTLFLSTFGSGELLVLERLNSSLSTLPVALEHSRVLFANCTTTSMADFAIITSDFSGFWRLSGYDNDILCRYQG
jgi:hypothetical protein